MKLYRILFLLLICTSCATKENLELESKITYEYLSKLTSEEQKEFYNAFSTEDKIKFRKKESVIL
jgi:hypothetical protein